MMGVEGAGAALLLTLVAGAATGIGGLLAMMIKKPQARYLSFALGLSAGVMIYVSFLELLPRSIEDAGEVEGVLAFFAGILLVGVIDLIIPEQENPHHCTQIMDEKGFTNDKMLMRTGMMTAMAIAIHNFPEGMSVFAVALNDLELGGLIAVAIAIHNIPEGIAVAMPLLYSSGSRRKALWYSTLSGLAEPAGAMIGLVILLPFLSESVIALTLGFVAGVMVYVSVDELLPAAHRYGHGHSTILGIVLGMAVMAITLLFM